MYSVSTTVIEDTRGSFSRLFCQNQLKKILGSKTIVQMNHSLTKKVGSIRGLHYQLDPFSEIKLVRCIKGKVWDVAVDIRTSSKTFGKWYAEELSQENSTLLVIPRGFAHGFQVLEQNSELIYLHTEAYQPDFERGLNYNDSTLKIKWPLPVTDVSKKDQELPPLS